MLAALLELRADGGCGDSTDFLFSRGLSNRWLTLLFSVPSIIKTRRAVRRIQLQRVRKAEDARRLQREQECSGSKKAAGADSGWTEGVADAEGTYGLGRADFPRHGC